MRKAYTGSIQRVDPSTGDISAISTETYADLYHGGRGLATKIYLDEVDPHVGALDPENRLLRIR